MEGKEGKGGTGGVTKFIVTVDDLGEILYLAERIENDLRIVCGQSM